MLEIVTATALLAVGLVGFSYALYATPERVLAKTVRAAQRREASTWIDGEVARFVGTVRAAGEPLRAPLTGRLCVAYRVEAKSSGDRKYERGVAAEFEAVPFVLEGASGRAIVDPRDADVQMAFDHCRVAGPRDSAELAERRWLAARVVGARSLADDRLTYLESVLELGEPAAAIGRGTLEQDPDAPSGFLDAQKRVRMTSTAAFTLRISDDPRTTAFGAPGAASVGDGPSRDS